MFKLSVFLLFSLMMKLGTRTQKNTKTIAAEGNCQQFSKEASEWAGWMARGSMILRNKTNFKTFRKEVERVAESKIVLI